MTMGQSWELWDGMRQWGVVWSCGGSEWSVWDGAGCVGDACRGGIVGVRWELRLFCGMNVVHVPG